MVQMDIFCERKCSSKFFNMYAIGNAFVRLSYNSYNRKELGVLEFNKVFSNDNNFSRCIVSRQIRKKGIPKLELNRR